MEIISNAIHAPKTENRLYNLVTDRVFIPLVLAFSALAVLDQSQAYQSFWFSLQSMLQIAPFFILAIAFAGFAKATGIDAHIARVFSGRSWMTIVAASLAGALSPFCSCGVIPMIAAMLASGVPLAPVMAFCISSPIMDPEMFIITASGISLNFAIAKTFAAIGMGLAAGFAVSALQRIGFMHQPLKRTRQPGCCQSSFNAHAGADVSYRFWQRPERRSLFMQEIRENGLFLGKWMLFAFFLESLMIAYIPADWIANLVGDNSNFAIPFASVVGIPCLLYTSDAADDL